MSEILQPIGPIVTGSYRGDPFRLTPTLEGWHAERWHGDAETGFTRFTTEGRACGSEAEARMAMQAMR